MQYQPCFCKTIKTAGALEALHALVDPEDLDMMVALANASILIMDRLTEVGMKFDEHGCLRML